MNIYKKLSRLFYPILILSLIFFVIPGKYKMAIYSLNYLGWITAILVFISLLLFLFLSAIDIKNKKINKLRILIFILAILICKITSFYDAKRNDKLTKEDLKEIFGD